MLVNSTFIMTGNVVCDVCQSGPLTKCATSVGEKINILFTSSYPVDQKSPIFGTIICGVERSTENGTICFHDAVHIAQAQNFSHPHAFVANLNQNGTVLQSLYHHCAKVRLWCWRGRSERVFQYRSISISLSTSQLFVAPRFITRIQIEIMGQYYRPCIITTKGGIAIAKAWLNAHSFGNGLKQMEHSYPGNNFVEAFEWLISPKGPHHKSQVVWAGDYGGTEEGYTSNLYKVCTASPPKATKATKTLLSL